MTEAYLITDSRYWAQAQEELDKGHWHLVLVGVLGCPKDWLDWLVVRTAYYISHLHPVTRTDSEFRAMSITTPESASTHA